jgi:hydroxymethylpyrimidine pyrophosphatase-like HAD family hydrolase
MIAGHLGITGKISQENFSLISNPENRIYQEQQVHKCVIQHLLKFLVDKTKQIEI